MARWWAEFTTAEPDELAYYGGLIRRFGEPALDLACGTGRLLRPLVGQGLEVDGVDISPDMVAEARRLAAEAGLQTTITAQPMHEVDLPRHYRTIYCCGSFGLGATRAQDRQALQRIHDHLEPGGAAGINVDMPWLGESEAGWARWLPGRRTDLPHDWDATSDRRRLADGDDLELLARFVAFDPLAQSSVLEMRMRLWHDERLVKEEQRRVDSNIYFAQEMLLLMADAGFRDVRMETYTGTPATPDDGRLVFVGRRGP
jgi:SAM-dependent methyltransferase